MAGETPARERRAPWLDAPEGVGGADLVAVPILYVPVQCVVADVGFAPDEPFWRIGVGWLHRVDSCFAQAPKCRRHCSARELPMLIGPFLQSKLLLVNRLQRFFQ
jgi:hypothetical protein